MKNLKTEALKYHKRYAGKIEIKLFEKIKNRKDLSLAYTPGVAAVCLEIAKNPEKVYDYTLKSRTIAVVTDGSAVLGLGNIGAKAALPVMEGKSALFKTFANLDAVPICLGTQDVEQIVEIVTAIAPTFGGINLEDISAPRCFEVEERLQNLGIPVMHDDQHGTAIVVTAGLINAAKLAKKKLSSLKIVILGAGAAGNGICQLLAGLVGEIMIVDSQGIVSPNRQDLDKYKKELLKITNPKKISGGLKEALVRADVFIGVSKAGLFKPEYIKLMNPKPIIFALANPEPEIEPNLAKKSGAFIVATGRSDFPNQINNSLAFPGVFRGAADHRVTQITKKMQQKAAKALASLVTKPKPDYIIPKPFDKGVVKAVALAIRPL